MSKQRTQRGSKRTVPRQQAQRAARESRAARAARQERRAARRQTRPRGHTGWAGMRRSRPQKIVIAALAAVGVAVIWVFADWELAVPLSALVLLVLPAVVVLTMGRRY